MKYTLIKFKSVVIRIDKYLQKPFKITSTTTTSNPVTFILLYYQRQILSAESHFQPFSKYSHLQSFSALFRTIRQICRTLSNLIQVRDRIFSINFNLNVAFRILYNIFIDLFYIILVSVKYC